MNYKSDLKHPGLLGQGSLVIPRSRPTFVAFSSYWKRQKAGRGLGTRLGTRLSSLSLLAWEPLLVGDGDMVVCAGAAQLAFYCSDWEGE